MQNDGRTTRIALISDIHGNDVAFGAVLDSISGLRVDQIVCLGDVVQGGPQPAETLERLETLDCLTVLGNADAFLLEVAADSPEPLTEQHLDVREWTLSRLEPEQVSLIRAFEPTIELEVDSYRLLCFHGSPRSYHDLLLPDFERASVAPYEDHRADLLAGGHTHTQWTRRIGEALYVNPGSVGLAYDRHQPEDDFKLTPVAEYALVFLEESGLSVEFRRIPYSFEELREATAAGGRPYGDDFVAQWRVSRRS